MVNKMSKLAPKKQLINLEIIEYLIKWENQPIEKVTWEDYLFMQKHS